MDFTTVKWKLGAHSLHFTFYICKNFNLEIINFFENESDIICAYTQFFYLLDIWIDFDMKEKNYQNDFQRDLQDDDK